MGNTEESFQKDIEEIEEDGAGGVKNFVEILRRMENGTERAMGENLVDNTAENVENEKEEKEGGRGKKFMTQKRLRTTGEE